MVAENGTIVGILEHKQIINNAKNGSLEVGAVMKTNFNTISEMEELNEFFVKVNATRQRFFPVTDYNNNILGAIDVTNVSEFLMLKTQLIS